MDREHHPWVRFYGAPPHHDCQCSLANLNRNFLQKRYGKGRQWSFSLNCGADKIALSVGTRARDLRGNRHCLRLFCLTKWWYSVQRKWANSDVPSLMPLWWVVTLRSYPTNSRRKSERLDYNCSSGMRGVFLFYINDWWERRIYVILFGKVKGKRSRKSCKILTKMSETDDRLMD